MSIPCIKFKKKKDGTWWENFTHSDMLNTMLIQDDFPEIGFQVETNLHDREMRINLWSVEVILGSQNMLPNHLSNGLGSAAKDVRLELITIEIDCVNVFLAVAQFCRGRWIIEWKCKWTKEHFARYEKRR